MINALLCRIGIHRHYRIDGRYVDSEDCQYGYGCVKHTKSAGKAAFGTCLRCGFEWEIARH